jgi:two-component sensor histidine kinase
VDLLAVISKCLALYDPSNDGRVLLEGDPQRIPSRAALPLCMALQELGNNASKYGALSQPGGRVRVAWRFEKTSNLLRINWAEQGGPPVQPPTHRGFGSDLIQNTVAHDLGGDVSLSFPATGARCEICFPIGRLTPPPL